MNIFNYFQSAHALGLKPALLEFTHPNKKTRLEICAIRPMYTLEVRDGCLYKDGILAGEALDIFSFLAEFSSDNKNINKSFFPSYIGYFSYEFADYLAKKTHAGKRLFPDAFFQYFCEGLVIDNGEIIQHDPLPEIELKSPMLDAQALIPAMDQAAFSRAVDEIKEKIRAGDLYQVNLSMAFDFSLGAPDAVALYQAMREYFKSPFMAFFGGDNWQILSQSPERLFSLHDNTISARPIAGTRKRGDSAERDQELFDELMSSSKENAEHAMLLDMVRNDINQVAKPGSMRITEDRSVEFYPNVMHLVSELSAYTEKSLGEIFAALFPGATITGAPKENVMACIAELENAPRGPYTGSLGYISRDFGCDFNILIRSVLMHHQKAWINTGAGIVIDSINNHEWKEAHNKAQNINNILSKKFKSYISKNNIINKSLEYDHIKITRANHNVLFIEHKDSFSFNIVEAVRRLGAHCDIHSNYDLDLANYSHIILGPGPGNPEHMPDLINFIIRIKKAHVAALGICLGHQALAHAFGIKIERLALPVHGHGHEVKHNSQGLFAHLPNNCRFGRYHSLHIKEAPRDFIVDAWTNDDCIMAIRHKDLPLFGVQFHPESYLSPDGLRLIGNFLGG
jgi:anthranilate synthase